MSDIMSDDLINMPKVYEAQAVEDALYSAWMEKGYFNPDYLPKREERRESFSMVLPPPNVTGTLHMGHAAMLAIEDVMVRFARMQGKDTLWLPGTDHAAIATESKVEKLMIEQEGINRHDLGKDAFMERVHAFAKESHDTIVNQVKKMGASIDWSREAYTLDAERNLAVRTAFTRMFEDGLIYKGHRIVNWDPKGQTTVSDEEVEYKEGMAKMYTFTYGKEIPIPISTTRPETKVGDTAIAVHPEDPRYVEFIGNTYEVDFAGTHLSIKVVGDKEVDPSFGTGALGVTPAHSIVDSEIAERHDLPVVQVIGKDGCMMESAGTLVAGKTALEARAEIVAWLRNEHLLQKEEEIEQNLSVAQRSGGAIEPLPMEQWFINVNKSFSFRQSERNPIEGLEDGEEVTLKKLMQHVVKNGQVKIMPDRFEKTYFHWIDNLRDWNISRQIWFGHQVPVWYKDGETYVGVEEPKEEGWVQDSDTLDTWFSSGLWTFSTLGWPNKEAEDFRRFHPTQVMETGYDILFFWVARMVLMSTYLVGEIPFETVYLHGLVRDDQGRKMSKSLGNVLNPLDMISEYGADATRLSLLIGATPGNDMKLSTEKVAGFRNFTNKLWNISRFVFMTVEKIETVEAPKAQTQADAWILHRLQEVTEKVTASLEEHALSQAGEILRDFTWNEFADWYIEIAKVQKREGKEGTDEVLLFVLQTVLKMWHPIMPFVTEEIWKEFGAGMLIVEEWPNVDGYKDIKAVTAMERTIEMIAALRNMRAEYAIPYTKNLPKVVIVGEEDAEEKSLIQSFIRVDAMEYATDIEVTPDMTSLVVGSTTIYVPLAGMIDVQAEYDRLEKEQKALKGYAMGLEKKLGNQQYRDRAPEAVVKADEERLQETQEKLQTIQSELERLKAYE